MTGQAEPWLGFPLPVDPLKGEILRMSMPGRPLGFDVVAPGISLFARPDGQVWLASTQERRGFDKEPSESAYRHLFGNATALDTAIKDATLLQQTVCLRPVTPDDLPIVGAVPGCAGAYVATGGGTKGILLASAMGKAMAELHHPGQHVAPHRGLRSWPLLFQIAITVPMESTHDSARAWCLPPGARYSVE